MLIRKLSPHTVPLAGDTDNGTKFETGAATADKKTASKPGDSWSRTLQRQRVEDSRCCNVADGNGGQPTFEDAWKTWEHQVDIYENLAGSKLDVDVNISVVWREAPPTLRDNLLVNSHQFD